MNRISRPVEVSRMSMEAGGGPSAARHRSRSIDPLALAAKAFASSSLRQVEQP